MLCVSLLLRRFDTHTLQFVDFCAFFLVFLSYIPKKQYLCSALTALLRSRVRKRYKKMKTFIGTKI